MMKKIAAALFLAVFSLPSAMLGQSAPYQPQPATKSSDTVQTKRPHITGISHLCVYASDAAATEHFYVDVLGAIKGADPEDQKGLRYYFSARQYVEVLPLPAGAGISRIDHVAFTTDDASALRASLKAQGSLDPTEVRTVADSSQLFEIKDPEGNKIQFVQPANIRLTPGSETPVSSRVIHIGYMVHDRAGETRFYQGLLGFRPYWFGAMQPDKVDWVSLQVPDGFDWLEFMLVGNGSTTPIDHVDQRELGVLNHFSLGVANMEQAMTMMISQERLSPRHDGPQMGKDGKWQANFYDPDGTRVELMEFQPVMKPCCSAFTANSPSN